MVSGESGPVHVGRAFFENFPAHPETSIPPQLKVTLRFILPDDPATSDTASPAIIAGYKLQITNVRGLLFRCVSNLSARQLVSSFHPPQI